METSGSDFRGNDSLLFEVILSTVILLSRLSFSSNVLLNRGKNTKILKLQSTAKLIIFLRQKKPLLTHKYRKYQ